MQTSFPQHDDLPWSDLDDARRALDLKYAERTPLENRKPYFEWLVGLGTCAAEAAYTPAMVDVGCATGAFCAMLLERFPDASVTGIDIVEDLLAVARNTVPGATFLTGDIQDARTLPDSRFDLVFANTLHTLFDTPEDWLPNVLKLLAPNGWAFVFGLFNPFDIDVAVRVRRSGSQRWMSGWSMVSRKTIENALTARPVTYRFIDYHAEAESPQKDDPLRSWVRRTVEDEYETINGIGLVHHFAALEIRHASAPRSD